MKFRIVILFLLLGLAVFWIYSQDQKLLKNYAHQTGMRLIMSGASLQQAFIACPNRYRVECRHGVVMAYLTNKYQQPTNENITNVCNDLRKTFALSIADIRNCYHAGGHALFNGKSSDAITQCSLFDETLAQDCVGGVLMESTRDLSIHHDIHKNSSLQETCRTIEERYKKICKYYLSLQSSNKSTTIR